MNIEQLTKAQIILLTLLISFVTSIATGIVTVTLLDQAPPAVTQTINRVVERTIERVVQGDSDGTVVTKETTVVVKENDLITESIDKNARNVVRIYRKSTGSGDDVTDTFVGLGIVVSGGGLVATDASIILDAFSYRIVMSDDQSFDVKVIDDEAGKSTALLAIQVDGDDVSFGSVSISDVASLQLGQTVIALGGRERTNVAIGIISGLIENDLPDSTEKVLSIVQADINKNEVLLGSPLINIFGEVLKAKSPKTRSVLEDLRFLLPNT